MRFFQSVFLAAGAVWWFDRAYERFQIGDVQACLAMLGCFVVFCYLARPTREDRAPSKPDRLAGA